ncbi:MAG: hypothetical protein CMJ65_14075 [Planctomycetaceae bacterium]|jgi:hypothetical protein|nr:hypothetical protein [Planctomycetaceae bacterium]
MAAAVGHQDWCRFGLPVFEAVGQMNSTNDPAATARVPFAVRPASATWEWLPLDESGTSHVWAWFRPPVAPQGAVFRPAEGDGSEGVVGGRVTLGSVLSAAGIDAATVSAWMLLGVMYPGPASGGAAAMVEQLIPAPGEGVDPSITVQVAVPAMGGLMPMANDSVYETITAHWMAVQKSESKLISLRKQLAGMMTRLNTLNRDLNHEEKSHASRQDRDDWEDARRWLRNAVSGLSRYIKAFDVGDTRLAGKKDWLQKIYEDCVVVRQPIDNPQAVESEFEFYRKSLMNLESQMSGALSHAGQEGQTRAQGVLAQIAAKVRRNRSG